MGTTTTNTPAPTPAPKINRIGLQVIDYRGGKTGEFRYRNELVAGCTCNGKDRTGLAPVGIENDPTLRRGDIVAGADGLMVAGRSADRRGASLNLSPAPEKLRSRYQRVPVVAAE